MQPDNSEDKKKHKNQTNIPQTNNQNFPNNIGQHPGMVYYNNYQMMFQNPLMMGQNQIPLSYPPVHPQNLMQNSFPYHMMSMPKGVMLYQPNCIPIRGKHKNFFWLIANFNLI